MLTNSGWGADFNGLCDGMLLALSTKKPMLVLPARAKVRQIWQYSAANDGSKATCSSKDINCYFLPITKCEVNHSQSYQFDKMRPSRNVTQWPWLYQYLTRGQQWTRRAVANYVDSQRLSFPPNEACTVIHVRRGDIMVLLARVDSPTLPVNCAISYDKKTWWRRADFSGCPSIVMPRLPQLWANKLWRLFFSHQTSLANLDAA